MELSCSLGCGEKHLEVVKQLSGTFVLEMCDNTAWSGGFIGAMGDQNETWRFGTVDEM